MKTLQFVFFGILAGVIIGVSGYFLFDRYSHGTLPPQENPLTASGNGTVVTTNNSASVATLPLSFAWEFKEISKANDTTPYREVSLISEGKTYQVGTYQGSCTVVDADETGVLGEKADADELSPRVQCWFAGGGDEIGLFKDGAGYSVKVGELGEGIEGGAPFRGNFKATIPL